jgi:transposase
MSEIITVGLDLAKNVFQAHGADASGRAVLRKKLRRDQVLVFFGQLPTCVVAMEACGGAHFWGLRRKVKDRATGLRYVARCGPRALR